MTEGASAHPEFESEQQFLEHAHRCLEEMRSRVANAGDAGGDPKASAALMEQRRIHLEHLDDPDAVLFGRLDFEDGDRHYIGPRVVYAPGGKVVAISWAAPVAKPFYEASPTEPLGLTQRRRLQTQRERLLGIADEQFGEGASGPTLDDLLLDELGRERTAEMRQVAATIKQDQYRIIERPLDSATIVQGGPGTGKTVVGLHRAALLLYRHRKQLTAQRVLIVGPNKVFMQYISYVLPSLGETAADQVTPDALVELTTGGNDESVVARVKGDQRMAEVLERALADRVRPPDDQLSFAENGITFFVEAGEVRQLIEQARAGGRSHLNARLQFRAAFERAVEGAYRTAFAKARPGYPVTAISGRRLPEFERALDRIWPTVSAADFVRQFLSSEERIERASAGLLKPSEQKLLYRKPVERLEQVLWSPSDLPLVDEVQALLEPSSRRYGHVVLDEAQDLTPMQLRMIGRRISGEAVTVLGDLAQATGLWSYSTWDEIMRHLLGDETAAEVSQLIYAYRVPQEIMNVALPVLQLTAPSISPPRPFRHGGQEPVFLEAARDERFGEAIDRSLAAGEAGGTVAIIAPVDLLPELRAELNDRGIDFADAERGELGASIELLDPVASKGLEFDHVVLLEPAAIIRGAEGVGQRDLYVALTRATRTLTGIHSEPLPWPLGAQSMPSRQPGIDVPDPSPTGGAESAEPIDPAAASPGSAATSVAGTVDVTLDEAFVLARKRGLDLEEAVARVLLVADKARTELDLTKAVLDPTSAPAGQVAAVVAYARHLAAAPDSS